MNVKDSARLFFEGKAGDAIVVSLIDIGGRLHLICQDIECVKPIMDMPNLPVARVTWRPNPDLVTGVECWITAGGAHHTVLSYDVTADMMKDFANKSPRIKQTLLDKHYYRKHGKNAYYGQT